MLRHLFISCATLAMSGTAWAEPYQAKPLTHLLHTQNVAYDEGVPLPEDVLGYASGEIIFPPHMLHSYARAVAAVSDRVTVEEIGRSHFGRPILRVTITSPENHARLDDVRQAHIEAGRAGSTVSDDLPLVVQFTHGVHGSEPSGYDSSAPLLYHLAASQDDDTRTLLETTIVHQIILINPDGANRFANYTNDHHAQYPVADPQHREHTSSWPWGRTNHYWFDLNRQWLPATQPEAVALINATHDWQPHVATDLHEMGTNSTFFFSPGPLDGLHPLLSQDGLNLNLQINEGLFEQFDHEQALFVSEEFFDDFYLGYGSSYPGLVGSVPYLFEQSSARGLVQDSDFGEQRYDEKIGQQARTALSLIRSAHANRSALIAHRQNFAQESARLAQAHANSGYVFTSTDPARLTAFIDLLNLHRIEVYRLGRDVSAEGDSFSAEDSYVVPLRQHNFRIIEGLFETRIIEDKTEFYDVSGWTQPLAYDLDYAALRGGRGVLGERVTHSDLSQPDPAIAEYAYVMEWSSAFAPRALYRLLNKDIKARLIPDPVSLSTPDGEVSVPRGSVMIALSRQDVSAEEIHAELVRAAREDGVRVHAVNSGHTSTGSDLGGFRVSTLEKPVVLLVTGDGVSSNDAGELWHLLDKEMHIPVSMIDQNDLTNADLSGYTHILMPHGFYGNLGENGAESLKTWVQGGGALIASRGATRFLVEHDLTSAEFPESEDGEEVERPQSYAELTRWESEQAISGALFAAHMDITHPLAFGFEDDQIALHRIGTQAFAQSDNPFASLVQYTVRDPLLSGYASPENRTELAGQTAVYAERQGQGTVVLFADNPYFRAYFKGPSRLVTNALFFQDAFRNPRRRAQ